MKEIPNISGAELEVMEALWSLGRPAKIQEICDSIESGRWKYNTVGTLLLRMAEKGAVVSEKINRVIYYSAVVSREEYKRAQTKNLISRLYNGSARELAVALFRSDDMTEDDIEEIRKMFDL